MRYRALRQQKKRCQLQRALLQRPPQPRILQGTMTINPSCHKRKPRLSHPNGKICWPTQRFVLPQDTSTRSGLLGLYALYLNHPRLYSPEACARSSRRQMYGIIIMVQVGLSCLSCLALAGAIATSEEACLIGFAAFNCCSCCCVIPVICNVVRTPSLINWLQQQFQPSLACSLSGAKLYDAC